MNSKPLCVTVEFDSVDQAAYAHMFLSRCGFTEFMDRTEPHLGKEACTERAYKMRDAVNQIEIALERADVPRRIYE
jgi:hypothetical protein